MHRSTLSAIVAASLLASLASGQTPTDTSTPVDESLSDRTPTENLRSFRARAPGLTIQSSLARHSELINARVNGARGGDFSNDALDVDDGFTTGNIPTTTGSTTGGLGDLSGLLTLFGLGGADLNGLLGGLGGTGLIGGTTGVTTDGTTTGGTTAGGTASGSDPLEDFTPANGTEFTLEDLIRLRDEVEGTAQPNNANNNAQAINDIGGAIGRLPEFDPNRAQTATDIERPFRLRLADRLVSTTFVALNAALRLRPVIDIIKDGLRPLFFPTNTGNGGDGGNNGGGGTGGDNTTDGIGGIGGPDGGGSGSVMLNAPLIPAHIFA